jgi:hypothetical protein
MDERERELSLEVKTSRSGGLQIGERDIDGIGPSGYVVVLLTDRMLHGPRWILIPARGIQAKGYSEAELAESADEGGIVRELNRGWSDWILDREAWARVLEPGVTRIPERIRWCRREHPPRVNLTSDNLREVKLAEALAAFRDRIDQVATGGSGAQAEGQLHQTLLGDVLEQMGYEVTVNPVGVPDIVAKRPAEATADLRARLESWQPASERLGSARRILLALDSEELRLVVRQLRGTVE